MYPVKSLKDLKPAQSGTVIDIKTRGPIKRRLIDMGLTPGVEVFVRKIAPFGDPIEINIRGYELTIRKDEAKYIFIKVNMRGG